MAQFYDSLTLDQSARICADGMLVANVFAARTGLQDYLGREVDSRFVADKMVKVYRPESEVFKVDSLASYSGAPVTIGHPSVSVDAGNWRDYGVGEIHGEIARDGAKVRVPIIVRDAGAVQKATTTHRQLSMGYSTKLVFPTDGKHPDGTECDAYQTDIKINHIAFVPEARGGSALTFIDERPIMEDALSKTITVDGLPVNLGDVAAVEAVLTKKDAAIADGVKALADATAAKVAADATIAARDATIVELTAKLADAALTPAKLADAAKAYADVQAKAKAAGVTVAADADTAAIMKAVVDAKMGDAAKDYTADHVAIAFAALTKDAPVQNLAIDRAAPDAELGKARAAWLADKQLAHKGA